MLKILFTNPYELKNETKNVNLLFEAGMEALHLRKPRLSRKDIKNYIAKIDPQYHERIVLHSHYSLLSEFKLGGIHINKRSRLNWIFMNFMLKYYKSNNPNLQVSTTFTDLKDFSDNNEEFSYILLGPLFNHNYAGNCLYRFYKTDLVNFLENGKLPIFALGGLKIERVSFVKELGFDGYVLQSAIWKSLDPVSVFKEFRDLDRPYSEAV